MNTTKSFPNLLNEALETSSNISDNHSECLSSSLSSLSGLTGYEEELSDLKHLIKLSPSPCLPYQITKEMKTSTNKQVEAYEERISKLNSELQNALRLNETYKYDILNLKRKIELEFYDKFEKLLKNNVQLEGQLQVAKEHIHSLLNNKNVSNNSHTNKLVELELDYETKKNLLENEIKYWKNEAGTQENVNNKLKIELEETRINLSSKNNSNEGLKKKIVDIHVEMQNLNQENVRINNLLSMTVNELESLKKSELWYKEQLHQCREQKLKSIEEVSKLQLSLASKERNLDVLNSDLLKLKNVHEEFQLASLQERQSLLKTIDKFSNESPKVISITDEGLSRNYESTIESLNRELLTIKQAINEQQSSFEAINKQNSELVARNTMLQKTLNDKEIFITNLEYDKKDLDMKLEICTEKEKQTRQLVINLMNEKSKLEIALNGANQEKSEIQDAINTIRENFSKFALNYHKIKGQLNEKNKEMLEKDNRNGFKVEEIKKEINELKEVNWKLRLQAENNSALNNEMKKLNEINEKCKSEVRYHQETIAVLKEELNTLKQNMMIMSNELHLKDQLVSDQYREINNLRTQIVNEEKLKSEVVIHLETIERLKNEIETFRENVILIKNELQVKDDAIKIKDKEISDLKSEVMCFSQTNTSLSQSVNELNQLNKLLKVENCELNDKLTKFIANNFNGFNNRTNKIEQNHTEKINELERWFLDVLGIISTNLNEIKMFAESKQNIINFYLKYPNEKFKHHFEEINDLLVHFEKSQRVYQNRLDKEKLKHKITDRLNQLQDKIYVLDKDLKIFEDLRNSGPSMKENRLVEEIKQLKILVKAKELENKEKQKRCETNNRTLLKKVKEHMRGRNSAEKHCSYLQELYNNVSDELNSYKLQDSSKDSEIQNLQNLCENYKNINNKLKQEILGLQKELSIITAKNDLINYDLLKENLTNLEGKLKIAEDKVKEKDLIINNLQIEIQEINLKNVVLEKEKRKYLDNTERLNNDLNEENNLIMRLKSTLETDRKALEEVQEKLLHEQKQHAIAVTQIEKVQQTFQHIQERNNLLNEEIESLNHKLDCNSSELINLKEQKIQMDKNWMEKQNHMQSFITKLQSEIQVLQSDLLSARSEKHFLQRLCKDLKIALQTCMSQSKALKKHIQTLTSGPTREYNSLPDSSINLPSPSKYDEDHINQLLKQSSTPSTEKPLSDLEKCLNSLKQEMICLRKQVTEGIGHQM
ncbi:hypothetical protein ILUMI_22531 [Ignelater luminosus]|uniref:Uncharacterized protein n=1 Tax=Ignelater luminosus TaxID=2038154 RepID=A0A8K0CAI3_IGNLU|nr:hypothetical protein ILUMI_22531 [Ignelater luminosus]